MSVLNFKHMTRQALEERFGLTRIRNHPRLHAWIQAPSPLSEFEVTVLRNFQDTLLDRIEDWNEQELILKFIGPLLALINFDTDAFSSFAERPLAAHIGDDDLSGIVDFMIASGKQTPKAPYFCLHEYKKELGTENDPAGQVLAAMLAAQNLNQQAFPIYGAYVVGRNWFFMLLDGSEYSISNEYAATKDELFDIAGILKALKQKLLDRGE